MKKITQEELNEILEKHKKWLEDNEVGERADLSVADLSGANLSVANLSVADLSGANLSRADLSGANLRWANLRVADLRWANLSGADLRGADLSGANLSGADLSGADLSVANLSVANLSVADLSGANLSGADLRVADLSGANLSGVNLSGADLRGADLSVANLRWANLSGAKNISFPISCPEEGEFIGFKKAKGGYIVKLKITEDAKRCSASGRKCRCSKALVLSITKTDGTDDGTTEIASSYDKTFIYRVGEIVEVAEFCENRWNECAPGIHFFITRKEAERYNV